MISIDELWQRIKKYEGETFTQIRGKNFQYTITASYLTPNTTNYNISRNDFEKALQRVPFTSTVPLQKDLMGPSYIFAIVNDKRIRRNDW